MTRAWIGEDVGVGASDKTGVVVVVEYTGVGAVTDAWGGIAGAGLELEDVFCRYVYVMAL